MYDPLSCAVDHVTYAMKVAFDPDSQDPPLGGGTTDVKFFHADGAPIAWFNAHLGDSECDGAAPFLWVRVVSRYLTSNFPTPEALAACGSAAAEIEIGIARCSYLSEHGEVDFDRLRGEANISLDDSRRLEKALCLAAGRITNGVPSQNIEACGDQTARDIVQPWGPEGGVVAWITSLYVQL